MIATWSTADGSGPLWQGGSARPGHFDVVLPLPAHSAGQALTVHLRTDPQFYFQSQQELFEAYASTAKRIDPELVRLFNVLPRTPYGVRPIPDTSAPNTTTAYYQGPALDGSRPGYYYANLYRPEDRPKYEIGALAIHEVEMLDGKFVKVKWVSTNKGTKDEQVVRCRLVAQELGYGQRMGELFAGTPSLAAVKMWRVLMR